MPPSLRSPFLALAAVLIVSPAPAAEKPRPLMRDFIGLNVHTVQFKPKLYAPVARLVRDYHPVDWDIGKDINFPPAFPRAHNGVDWKELYGAWHRDGYRIDACLIFDNIPAAAWKNLPADATQYGAAFARAFGPSAATPFVESVEIGNEPGKYEDAAYRTIFEAMARGVREGDSKLRIATCAVNLGPSGKYSKSVDLLTGLEALYDIVNVHIYAEAERWPTFRRSYPEDPKTEFLADMKHILTWRAEHAADKEVWLTEFGWDASNKPAPATGTFAKWIGNSEAQQAQWIVRGYLLLAALGVDRAYLFFFNDDDQPQIHGSSGITRNFAPKPSFHAVAWLQRSLGDYRFSRVLREDAGGYVYEFAHGTDPEKHVLAVWTATGPGAEILVDPAGRRVTKTERMPLAAGDAEAVTLAGGKVPADERPLFLWLEGR